MNNVVFKTALENNLIGFLATTSMTGAILGVMMMFITKFYLNRSTRRGRLIELIFGRNNTWYHGKEFDFVTANYVIPGSLFSAWRLKTGMITSRQKENGIYAYPSLHKNGNYLILIKEFRFFTIWEIAKAIIIISSLSLATIGMGLDKGWW